MVSELKFLEEEFYGLKVESGPIENCIYFRCTSTDMMYRVLDRVDTLNVPEKYTVIATYL